MPYQEPKYKLPPPNGGFFFRDDKQLRESVRLYMRWLPARLLWWQQRMFYYGQWQQWIIPSALLGLPLIGGLVVVLVFVPARLAEFIILVWVVGMTYWALRNWEG